MVKAKSKFVFVIRRPGSTEQSDAHVRRLRRFCGADQGERATLISNAISKEGEWKAEKILSWRHKKNSASVELEIRWAGFNRDWATFEKLEAVIADPEARSLVRKFLRKELQKKSVPILQEKLDQLEAGSDGAAPAAVQGPFKQRKTKTKKSKRKKLKADRAILQAKVSLYWPGMKEWYDGIITHVDPEDEALTVTYEDGEELTYPPNFKGWKWKVIEDAHRDRA